MAIGGFGDINHYDKLTVEKLQTYIRPGCYCVVCNEAQAQLAERSS
jgi:hypothetical protein